MTDRSTQIMLRIGLVAFVIAMLLTVTSAMMPLLVALILSFILLPVVDKIEILCKDKIGLPFMPRWLAIIIAFILFFCLSVLVLTYILVPFVTEFSRFVHNIPQVIEQFANSIKALKSEDIPLPFSPQLEVLIHESIVKVGNYSVDLARQGLSAMFSLAGVLVQLLLVPILSFYIIKDARPIKNRFVSLFSQEKGIRVDKMLAEMYSMLGRYLRGQLLLACNMFCIVFIAMYLFGIPYPLVLSLLAAIAEWVPIIGPILGAAPAVILAFLIAPSLALKVAIFYGIVQLIDAQIIMPKVVGHVIKLHPIMIIVAIFTAGSFYGIPGMMLAVPITALIQILITHLWFYEKNFKGAGEQ